MDTREDDVVAYLLPRNQCARRMVKMEENISWVGQSPPHLRKTTCIVVTFSKGARTSYGVVFGMSPAADVILPRHKRLSPVQFAIRFDSQGRPIVWDIESRDGLHMIYRGTKTRCRNTGTLLLQGPSIAGHGANELVVTDDLRFEVILPPQDTRSPEYIAKVTEFRMGTARSEDLLASMNLKTDVATVLPSGVDAPTKNSNSGAGQNLFRRRLDDGGFAKVFYVWDPTTGDDYVIKSPLPRNTAAAEMKKRRRLWRQEADILRGLSHKHIIAYRGAKFDPELELQFEWAPEGALNRHAHLTALEGVQILQQQLSALAYMHCQETPMVHRDIKPANILVMERAPESIYVKFADFGLSKAGHVLHSICGTPLWAAPEIRGCLLHQEGAKEEGYSAAVDIWGLGIVIVDLFCGLPDMKDDDQRQPGYLRTQAWVETVRAHCDGHCDEPAGELLRFVLRGMLLENSSQRSGAVQCLADAQKLWQSMTRTEASLPDPLGDSRSTSDSDHGPSTADTPIIRPYSQLGSRQYTVSRIAATVQKQDECHTPSSASGAETLRPQPLETVSQDLLVSRIKDTREREESSTSTDGQAPSSSQPTGLLSAPANSSQQTVGTVRQETQELHSTSHKRPLSDMVDLSSSNAPSQGLQCTELTVPQLTPEQDEAMRKRARLERSTANLDMKNSY